jgi:hypothetical protein
MPAKQKSAEQKSKDKLRAFYACQEQQAAAKRKLCSLLFFWRFCGHKKCLRARACVVDFKDCFDRLWPLVPEEMKISIRTQIKASKAGLSRAETKAEIARELARWRETMAPRTAPSSPPVARAVPNAQAPSLRAPGPRVRVL